MCSKWPQHARKVVSSRDHGYTRTYYTYFATLAGATLFFVSVAFMLCLCLRFHFGRLLHATFLCCFVVMISSLFAHPKQYDMTPVRRDTIYVLHIPPPPPRRVLSQRLHTKVVSSMHPSENLVSNHLRPLSLRPLPPPTPTLRTTSHQIYPFIRLGRATPSYNVRYQILVEAPRPDNRISSLKLFTVF